MNTNPPPQCPVSLPLEAQRPAFAALIAEKTILMCDDLKAKAKNLASTPHRTLHLSDWGLSISPFLTDVDNTHPDYLTSPVLRIIVAIFNLEMFASRRNQLPPNQYSKTKMTSAVVLHAGTPENIAKMIGNSHTAMSHVLAELLPDHLRPIQCLSNPIRDEDGMVKAFSFRMTTKLHP
jgi:hypothetical protein